MFLVEWFYDVLQALGLYQKSAKILLLGLDNAGKTTLLSVLKSNQLTVARPTMHPNSETLEIGRIRFTAYDLGGHRTARRLWRDYCADIDAIVFVCDAVDRERFAEAKSELDALLQQEDIAAAPLLVLGNKIDVPSAASEAELRTALNMTATTGRRRRLDVVRPLELFMCSIVRRSGYAEAFQWLSSHL